MASIKDRTQEFHSAVESLRSRASNTALERRSLLASPPKGSKRHNELNSKSEFSLMAGQIGKEINLVAAKLEKLTKLAKRKTIFDDKPVEISELTFIIKQDIGKLNKQIAQLQDYVRTAKGPSKQASEHSSNVVVLLQSKLASTSMSFKDVLEIRTENMKASKNRREQFMFSAAEQSSPRPTISTSSPSDYMPTAASELHHRRKTHCGFREFSTLFWE
ncbi:t-SNARE [Endogone sp. FLAS-F59071]|nr:t-SNARE [Endogone sp. FLAS-F59071]|eukprot:RUS23442.1 t-SNARE [Endogone sp. FLAS-F59071]